MIGALLRFVTGGLLDKAFGFLERRQASEDLKVKYRAEVSSQAIQAELAAREAAKEVVVAEQKYLITRLHRSLFIYPLSAWWIAIIADSIFHFEWDVAALPAPLDEWAGWIIASLFLVGFGERMVDRMKR